MPVHPVSRLVRFALAVGTNVIFDHLGYRRPTVHPVPVIEAVELVACHVFNLADRDDQSVSMEMVRQRLARLREHPPGCCRLCRAAARWRPPTSTASSRRGSGRPPPPGCVRCADSSTVRDRAIRRRDRDLGPSPHTGQALILIPRATAAVDLRRPVPRSRADSPIAQIRANDRDRGLGPVGLAENREEDSRPTGVIRPSGRRRRRPTGSAPRCRTDRRTDLG